MCRISSPPTHRKHRRQLLPRTRNSPVEARDFVAPEGVLFDGRLCVVVLTVSGVEDVDPVVRGLALLFTALVDGPANPRSCRRCFATPLWSCRGGGGARFLTLHALEVERGGRAGPAAGGGGTLLWRHGLRVGRGLRLEESRVRSG